MNDTNTHSVNCLDCEHLSRCNNCSSCEHLTGSSFCTYCSHSDRLSYCRDLTFTSQNIFCLGVYNRDVNIDTTKHQKPWRVFNKEVGYDRYREIQTLMYNMGLFSNDQKKITPKQYYNLIELPEFDQEIFLKITKQICTIGGDTREILKFIDAQYSELIKKQEYLLEVITDFKMQTTAEKDSLKNIL